jgi:hypothetical protein
LALGCKGLMSLLCKKKLSQNPEKCESDATWRNIVRKAIAQKGCLANDDAEVNK